MVDIKLLHTKSWVVSCTTNFKIWLDRSPNLLNRGLLKYSPLNVYYTLYFMFVQLTSYYEFSMLINRAAIIFSILKVKQNLFNHFCIDKILYFPVFFSFCNQGYNKYPYTSFLSQKCIYIFFRHSL